MIETKKQLEVLMEDNLRWLNDSRRETFSYDNYAINIIKINEVYRQLYGKSYLRPEEVQF